jgi:hypothetical protein
MGFGASLTAAIVYIGILIRDANCRSAGNADSDRVMSDFLRISPQTLVMPVVHGSGILPSKSGGSC